MTQLELFDKQTDMDYAMSFTRQQLSELKNNNHKAYTWVAHIRDAVHTYRSIEERAKRDLERKLDIGANETSLYLRYQGYR